MIMVTEFRFQKVLLVNGRGLKWCRMLGTTNRLPRKGQLGSP